MIKFRVTILLSQGYTWLVSLETERVRNRIASSVKSFALLISVSVTAHSHIIPIIKSLSKNPKWFNVNY